ncbi:PHD/FYVE-zinc-finger like domain-containing protein [Talaromyces proteolyticus]|uniref:PHD/FYVE-zinc-finger like domain-containing protein n=1 Tax=Talaromyces proteolyticus TaxID=1131652 RepID=A0AAD4KX51_9EURO|nr:PHD/FYVE-zinc-finger like domain-containing protein [Talaromyces proteolyticus]KAH8701920.1 PHD/FYVE-zinc-finger like domain-containing protein [Talaromyces proteolyticus]
MVSDRCFSPTSDDADELVADLLQQFSSVSGGGIEPAIQSVLSSHNRILRTRHVTATSPAKPTAITSASPFPGRRTAAVVVPPPPSDVDFDFLPGHSTAKNVLKQRQVNGRTLYMVELLSLEKEWVPLSKLKTLDNGTKTLQRFEKYAPPKEKTSDQMRKYQSAVHLDGTSSSEEEDDDIIVAGPSKRRRRGRPPASTKRFDISDEDEEDDEDNSDDQLVKRRSKRQVKSHQNKMSTFWSGLSSSDDLSRSSSSSKRRRSTRQSTRRISARLRYGQSESESDEPQPRRGVRFSTRTKISNRRNLRERLEDDISENEPAETEKKFFGAKERFYKLPSDDPFRLRHRQICDTCSGHGDDREKGPLVFCQGCTYAYHKTCLGPRAQREHLVSKVGHDQFVLQCRRCIGVAQKKDSTAPHLGHCFSCKEEGLASRPFRERLNPRQEQQQRENNEGLDPITKVEPSLLDNVDNILFRCIECTRAFHFHHLQPKPDLKADDVEIVDADADPSESAIANTRFKQYSRRWRCYTCITAPEEIEALIAWRPVDADSYTPGFSVDVLEENDKEYLIKWKRTSYYRTTWMEGSWVWGVASPLMRKAFFKSPKGTRPQMTMEDAIPEDFLRIDIVLDVKYTNIVSTHSMEIDMARVKDVKEAYVKYKGLLYEDAVWETVPSPNDGECWEDFRAAYEDWVLKDYVRVPKNPALKQHLATVREQDFQSTLVKKAQPNCVVGGKIMDYQLDGLNWLYYMWYKQQNAILADEMGLGKTIQIISFLATLIEDHRCWPFLVVVPNSTCPNWRREVKKWTPTLRVVTYYGSAVARRIAHDFEMFPENARDLRAHIVVTSYESMTDDKARRVLAGIPWAGLIVDEGQRLKNDKNQLYDSLSRINFPFKVLLTGTPLQNSTRELFNLIQFCDPTRNAKALEEEYETLTKENVPELHDLIRPFFLRRTKAQVLTFLPPMAQIIVPVSMSVVQKKLYKSILAKNSKLIKSIFQSNQEQASKQNERHSLSNILMQLRKCLCHPFVYSRQIEERTSDPTLSHRNLVEASGKLQLLEHMLPKLKERGHRVLLFSQFLDNLDVVEDFLDGLGLLYLRLDGSMGAHEKQKHIDAFNEPNSEYFAFLLSTRSGGVGINLATADTVIILDPDFNPHQDIQALSRAHRIGQQKKVLVFQIMTRGSAEEKIMQIGKKKLVLDHVLIERMDAEDDEGVDLESILRHGAEAVFDDDNTGDIHFDSESVEKLLDRSQAEDTKVGNDASAESQFSFARVWANENGALEDRLSNSEASTPPNNNLWEKILAERQKAADEEALANAQALGRGKRKRTAVDYTAHDNKEQSPPAKSKRSKTQQADSDAEFKSKGDESEDTDPEEFTQVKKVKGRPFKRVDPTKPSSLDGNLDGASSRYTERLLPCIACGAMHPVGYCPLKLAGVEHCGLCGLAHIGYQRTCPHLNSEEQILVLLQALKQSTEPKALVDQARHYLYMVKGDLVSRRKKAETAAAGRLPNSSSSAPQPPSYTINRPPYQYLAPPQPSARITPSSFIQFGIGPLPSTISSIPSTRALSGIPRPPYQNSLYQPVPTVYQQSPQPPVQNQNRNPPPAT